MLGDHWRGPISSRLLRDAHKRIINGSTEMEEAGEISLRVLGRSEAALLIEATDIPRISVFGAERTVGGVGECSDVFRAIQ